MSARIYFQDFMPENKCFGCGKENEKGFQIKSFWRTEEKEEAWCYWRPEAYHEGWSGVLNGGVIATLMDCHCMATAMAHAYHLEGRKLDSEPIYRYATGTLNVRYLKPTPSTLELLLKARVQEVKGIKTTLTCTVWAENLQTVESEVIALRVYDSSQMKRENLFTP
ncbi:MAG: PaaI family thioesterase [Cytophagales bacterium]|nr:PaaI family thioesterase [Cytophagales bacterium]